MSYDHFQITLLDLQVNIEIWFSVYSIYVTYLFWHEEFNCYWLLVQDIQGTEMCEWSNLAWKGTYPVPWEVIIWKQVPETDVHHAGTQRGVHGLSKYKGYLWPFQLVPVC